MADDVIWRVQHRGDFGTDVPSRDWYGPGRVYLALRGGEPWSVFFLCPCGLNDDFPCRMQVDATGPHTLVSEDPLTLSPSVFAGYACAEGNGRCHFFIRDGLVRWV